MNEKFKIYTQELADNFRKAIDGVNIKVNESASVYKMIITSEVEDRSGDVVRIDGLDDVSYMKNPVVIVDHDYEIENIVGKTLRIYQEGKNLIADFIFAEGLSEKADLVKRLYDGGFIKASSIGFIPLQRDANNRDIILKWELLEWSFVVVPCNQDALSMDEKALLKKYFSSGLSEKIHIMDNIEDKIWDISENEYKYRLKEQNLFEEGSFKTITLQKSPKITATVGNLKGETTMTIQALKFLTTDYTLDEAKAWVEAHQDTLQKNLMIVVSDNDDITEMKSDIAIIKEILKLVADNNAEQQKSDELEETKKALQGIDRAVGDALKHFKSLRKNA